MALAAAIAGCGRPVRPVTVPKPVEARMPHLTVTKFMAFGDSITEGFVQHCPGTAAGVVNGWSRSVAAFLFQGRAQPAPTAYPTQLQALLQARYAGQTVTVTNEGLSGEPIEGGVDALPRVLTTDAPEVLLLQHGINTINTGQGGAIESVVNGLRRMIQEARSRGIIVFVGTLLPQRPGSCRAYDYNDETDDVVAANVQIRPMVGTEGAILVDLYEAFNGRTATLIGEDGLHPSASGYEAIAQTFFDAIRKRLED